MKANIGEILKGLSNGLKTISQTVEGFIEKTDTKIDGLVNTIDDFRDAIDEKVNILVNNLLSQERERIKLTIEEVGQAFQKRIDELEQRINESSIDLDDFSEWVDNATENIDFVQQYKEGQISWHDFVIKAIEKSEIEDKTEFINWFNDFTNKANVMLEKYLHIFQDYMANKTEYL